MTNLEIFYKLVNYFGEQDLTSEQGLLVLLTSIAQSLAVIADELTEQKKSESEG